MSTGFYFARPDGTHQALPVRDSCYSERTGQAADLLAASDHPVAAECQQCHGRIRLSRLRQMERRHDLTAPAPPAGDTPGGGAGRISGARNFG